MDKAGFAAARDKLNATRGLDHRDSVEEPGTFGGVDVRSELVGNDTIDPQAVDPCAALACAVRCAAPPVDVLLNLRVYNRVTDGLGVC